MSDTTIDDDMGDEADREDVERERESLRRFATSLTPGEIQSGNWFPRLLAQALDSYTKKVNWAYFQERYDGVPVDAIVDQRIKMAARYAAIEGGLSAGVYTGAVVATIGTAGGASPLTLPAAGATFVADVAFLSQLQLRLAYDISVLYRVPLDLADPEDMWKLLRVAFTIKSGEVVREGLLKAVPALVRPVVKKLYSGAILTAARGLPFVGKYLLQRNIIKVATFVGIPLAIALNRWTTLIAGRHARDVFRNEAKIVELSERLTAQTRHPQLMLWVAWLVIMADRKISDNEALLMRHLVSRVREAHDMVDEQLARVVDVDAADVWGRVEAESDDLSDVLEAATRVATVDGELNVHERVVLAELRDRCSRT